MQHVEDFFLSFFVNTYHMADFAFCIFGLDCDLKGDSGSRRPTDCGQASGGPDKGHRPAGAQSTFLEQLIEEKKRKKGLRFGLAPISFLVLVLVPARHSTRSTAARQREKEKMHAVNKNNSASRLSVCKKKTLVRD